MTINDWKDILIIGGIGAACIAWVLIYKLDFWEDE
jgi:hypothetical protein